MTLSLGLAFHRTEPAGTVLERAQAAETAGYDEFWVIEDCFYTAGVSLAATALAGTERIGVGIGILPAVARNPAITAMEVATLASLAPGRFHAGIGHGVQKWMGQIGARVDSPLTVLEETIAAVRELLAGETITRSGRYVHLDNVALDAPPDLVPPVSAGVRGPKSLELAGRVADGTILAEFCSPEYVRFARDHIGKGMAAADRSDSHRLTALVTAAVSPDGDAMRQALVPVLASVAEDPPISLTMAPFWPELSLQANEVGWFDAISAMPKEWWGEIAAVGTPDEAAAHLESLAAAGLDAAVLWPSPFDPIDDGNRLAAQLLP